MMGGSPEKVPETYRKASPVHFIKNIQGKLLIIQGGRDPNVTPENVKTAEIELKKYAIPYEVLLFEDEGHGIRKLRNQKILFRKLVDFFLDSFKS
jgi:dipeptidyl aminopeptidase/acylaminoacyl peptidase